MISPKNRVQAIKSKFENLNVENELLVAKKKNLAVKQLSKQNDEVNIVKDKENEFENNFAENDSLNTENCNETGKQRSPKPNNSYLYGKNDLKRSVSDTKKSLTRQTSDPGKKLHRSHAFRCDRSQKMNQSPKRHGSCNGRSETSDFAFKMGERKLTKERLKLLGNFIEDQMRKDNFPLPVDCTIVGDVHEKVDSIPDAQVPKHILDQYAKVVKGNKSTDKQDAMTDSGVSSETENLDEENRSSKIKQLVAQYEKSGEKSDVQEPSVELSKQETSVERRNPLPTKETTDVTDGNTNLDSMNDLCASSETMRLEKKNPHLKLTDTLKKALKQPLPPGPPPKKPPRIFVAPIPESPEKQRKDPRKMLEKLEQVLQQREAEKTKNIYDIAEGESTETKPKEMHYLCTEILDIARTLPNNNFDPFSKCFNSLNCAIVNNSMNSLPYTRLSQHRNSIGTSCSCSNDSLNDIKHLTTFSGNKSLEKCTKCQLNTDKNEGFICHLNCKCKTSKSEFYLTEHIYDVPFVDGTEADVNISKSQYGTLNTLKMSKSLEDLQTRKSLVEDEKVYDVPCEVTPPSSPKLTAVKTEFQKLRESFEKSQSSNEDDTKPNAIQRNSKSPNEENVARNLKMEIDARATNRGNGTLRPLNYEKPTFPPKPMLSRTKVWRSSENISEESNENENVEKKFSTDGRRYRRFERGERKCGFSLPKDQLNVDKENLNRLMTEIYETVTAACIMDEHKPSSFPTEPPDGSTSEESVRLTRSLTESRKNYVRRVSSRVAYLDQKNLRNLRFRHQTSVCSYKSEILDNPYSTFRSWKSFRTSQSNLRDKMDRADSTDSKFNLTDSSGNILSLKDDLVDSIGDLDSLSIDEKAGCVDIDLPFEPRDRGLFNVCLLVGLNHMTGEAYVKSVFPSQVQVPPHIENLIFPETISSETKEEWIADAKSTQCYSLVLTDERGERSYGYCRRVLPEGATTCLPLCYCLIGKYRAPGFYYKVLKEIESHHGSSEIEINQILEQLFEMDFPNPGEQISITYSARSAEEPCRKTGYANLDKCRTLPDQRKLDSRLELNVCVKKEALTDRSESLPDTANRTDEKPDGRHELPDFYDLENNNNSPKSVIVSVEGLRTHVIKRPLEARADEGSMSALVDALGAGLAIKVFASLLLERKVVVMGEELSMVSSCLEALQSSLYPLVWQQPLISCVPLQIRRDVLQAPLPILAGARSAPAHDSGFEEGMLIDLSLPSKVQFYQGDESTILPTSSYKALKTALQMESARARDRPEDTRTRNVLISEAFLRFFVDILGDFWKFFSRGEVKQGDLGKNGIVFDKEAFIKNASSKQNQYFLEWFTETAMFNHFVQNMAVYHSHQRADSTTPTAVDNSELVDTPLPNFYELFLERSRSRGGGQRGAEPRAGYRGAVHRKMRLLKTKLRELVA